MVRTLTHYIGGQHVDGASGRFADVYDPATGQVQARLPLASAAESAEAVAAADKAAADWAATNPQRRARILLRFVDLVNENVEELARLLSSEHGKTVADAKGDIQRGVEVVEFCAAAPHLLKGEFSDSAGPGIDVHSLRQPLGVVAGITPFNFPAMIPLWKAGPAIAAGNAFVLKPSERDPSVPLRLAELFTEAGLPDGVFNVLNGDKEAVDALIADERVRAVGFVGSTPIAQSIYAAAAAAGKRAQCFGGAKNHMVILPDADLDQAADALIGAAFGSAGERCMAVSVAVPVGRATADALVERLRERIAGLTVGPGTDPEADFGPVVAASARDRIEDFIEEGVEEGAELLVDGRGLSVPGHEDGFWIGPTLFDHVGPQMSIYREEIFGPVLSVVRAADYEEALRLPSEHRYGNGVAVFTRDGDAARDFAARVDVGMVGVNVPIPVPIAYYTFGGWKASGFGDLNQHGPDAFRFYTKTKTVTTRWPSGIRSGASFTMPEGS
ncbi:CoA-acylating methylmalonate-semialdehyde dehydrogenase [Zafaria sp. Z1313]|uniref:CoA-acylating methylmalonate-semialdehyde dehydrogenase n=1 Tax=unclassified Zafaria TaxID=2828765 RepID=UPI002E78078C|nr:CoA-acylating methylmalonate-semialdehyde dehydrogenase [Zafaria sp. J156]MEE1621823.1 CoA-acylating methylmalonate-semialdehyde dehydrogenase [Zafaria sp. J156]